MYSRNCACGASQKNFFLDIGPFYVDECCELAGYDHMGNKVEQSPEVKGDWDFSQLTPAPAEVPTPDTKLSKSKLKDMTAEEVASVAQSRGIQCEGLNKKKIIEAILAAQG